MTRARLVAAAALVPAVLIAGAALASPAAAATGSPVKVAGPVRVTADHLGDHATLRYRCDSGSIAVLLSVTQAGGGGESTYKSFQNLPCTGHVEFRDVRLVRLDPSYPALTTGKATAHLVIDPDGIPGGPLDRVTQKVRVAAARH